MENETNTDVLNKENKEADTEESHVDYHQPHLSRKEISCLNRNKYTDVSQKYKTAYVIVNKKTGMIVEMKAASSVHACNLIGWRPKNCRLISTIDLEEKAELQKNLSPIVDDLEEKAELQKNLSPIVEESVPDTSKNEPNRGGDWFDYTGEKNVGQ